jgi:hypothetical protein
MIIYNYSNKYFKQKRVSILCIKYNYMKIFQI